MKTMTAAQAKVHFGEFLDAAQREPVMVTKNSRPVGVFFSIQDIEDTVWAERAKKARAGGMIGAAAGKALLAELIDADD